MSQVLLKSARFSVERREYNVDGRIVVQRDVVVHPGAVAIIPLLSAEEVVLIRNRRFSIRAELLELPAGTLEPPETPLACAAREVEEETGYAAGHLEPLCEFYTTPGISDEKMYVFVATDLRPTAQRLDATEEIRVEVMPLAEALAATADGRIVDGKTIAALQVYHYRRARAV